jgi:hypothetical protein
MPCHLLEEVRVWRKGSEICFIQKRKREGGEGCRKQGRMGL